MLTDCKFVNHFQAKEVSQLKNIHPRTLVRKAGLHDFDILRSAWLCIITPQCSYVSGICADLSIRELKETNLELKTTKNCTELKSCFVIAGESCVCTLYYSVGGVGVVLWPVCAALSQLIYKLYFKYQLQKTLRLKIWLHPVTVAVCHMSFDHSGPLTISSR